MAYATHCYCGIASGLGTDTGTGFQSSSINVLNPKGPSININVHHNPNNVRKGGGGGKRLVRILILTKILKMSTIHAAINKHKLLSCQ